MQRTTDDGGNGSRGKRRKGGASGASGASAGSGTVIHVAFGSNGGRVDPSANGAGAATAPSEAPPPDGREPVTDLFTRREVAKLLNVSETRLRSLDRSRIVSPSGTKGRSRAYTFQDLIALRATRELLERQVRIKDVARAIGALRQALPRVTRPLQELRIVGDGRRVVVRAEEGSFEAITGQMVLDFQVQSLREDVVRVLRPETSQTRARTAYDLYVQASALDEDPATYAQAEELYERAIRLDPSLAIAYTNLGNIRFRRRRRGERHGPVPPRDRGRYAPARGPLQPGLRDARARRRARRDGVLRAGAAGRSPLRRRPLQPRDGRGSSWASAAARGPTGASTSRSSRAARGPTWRAST